MPLAIGQILQDRYRIDALLGQGGMGAVYLAEDLRLSPRRCAIKEMTPASQSSPQAREQARQQFKQEASTLATLDHPNLPKVSDYFSFGGNEYLVMDFVEGENLEQVLQRTGRPLPEAQVLAWADQLLDALEYLHGQRPNPVIHRDIKPQNIILTSRNRVKLVDFGLLKLLDFSSPATRTILEGWCSPPYTPPEQYPGSPIHTDARSDIYSLGATCYHLLTNKIPADVTQRTVNPSLLPPPSTLNPNISANVEKMIVKAMELDLAQRYQSATEMCQALRGQARREREADVLHQPDAEERRDVREPEVADGPPSWLRRYGWIVGSAAILAIALIGITMVVGTMIWLSRDKVATPIAGEPRNAPPPTTAPTIVVEPRNAPPPGVGNWTMTLGRVQNGLKLVSHSNYVDSLGNLWIVAEIQNLTDEVLGSPKIVLYLGDLTEVHWASMARVAPDDVAPVRILVKGEDLPPGVMEYTINVATQEFERWEQNYYYYDLAIENDQLTKGGFSEQGVTGEIINTGEHTVQHVKVFAAFYDADGTIIYTDYDFIDEDALAPGERAKFLVDMRNRGSTAASYKLWPESSVVRE